MRVALSESRCRGIRVVILAIALMLIAIPRTGHAGLCQSLLFPGEHPRTTRWIQGHPVGKAEQDRIEKQLRDRKILFFDANLYGVDQLDVDNDGNDDLVITLDYGGTMRTLDHLILREDLTPIPIQETGWWPTTENFDRHGGFVRHNGKVYQFTSDNDHNKRFAYIWEQGKSRVVCWFGYPQEPELVIQNDRWKRSRRPALCQAVIAGKVEQAVFDRPLKFNPRRISIPEPIYIGSNTFADDVATMIDLDADGQTEPVMVLRNHWGGGSGCGLAYLAIVDPTTGLPEPTSRNAALRSLTPGCTTIDAAPIRIDGQWYVFTRFSESEGPDTVARLHRSRVETMCYIRKVRRPFVTYSADN